MNEHDLYHHGVLGMKWGVRRGSSKIARAGKKAPDEPDHEDYTKAHVAKRSKSMSDKELRDRISRLQLEKQYKQLTNPEISAGGKFVQDILLNATKQTASSYVSKGMTKGIDTLIGSMLKKKIG